MGIAAARGPTARSSAYRQRERRRSAQSGPQLMSAFRLSEEQGTKFITGRAASWTNATES
jgi:hypothetical protein